MTQTGKGQNNSPLTFRGILILPPALLLFFLALPRGDLASQFWGAIISLTILLLLIYNRILTRVIKGRLKKSPFLISVTLPSKAVIPGEKFKIKGKMDLPRGMGIKLKLNLKYRFTENRVFTCTMEKPEEELTLSHPSRGHYLPDKSALIVEDLFGFTRSLIPFTPPGELLVHPGTAQAPLPPPPGGPSIQRDSIAWKTEQVELMDTRKYYPGDDTRKINWKIWAHLRELHIKKGATTPPPEKSWTLIIHNEPVPGLGENYQDRMINTITRGVEERLNRGERIRLIITGDSKIYQFTTPEERKQFLDLMAALRWQSPAPLTLPEEKNRGALLFSLPGTRGLDKVIRALESRHWRISLYFKDQPEETRRTKPSLLRRLLFIDHPPCRGNQDTLFRQYLAEELKHYKTGRFNDLGLF